MERMWYEGYILAGSLLLRLVVLGAQVAWGMRRFPEGVSALSPDELKDQIRLLQRPYLVQFYAAAAVAGVVIGLASQFPVWSGLVHILVVESLMWLVPRVTKAS